MAKGENCRNRSVVNVKNRLYSPAYDWDGDDGRAWNEVADDISMCFFGHCTSASYNAWIDATDSYYKNKLIPHYEKVVKRANSFYGGAALPQEISDEFNKTQGIINSWKKFDKTHKSMADDFWQVTTLPMRSDIRTVVDYFDDAACAVDNLNLIAAEKLKSPALAEVPPARTYDPSEGPFLGGSGRAKNGEGGSSMGAVGVGLGVVAAGAGAFFLYKVLTE